MTQEEMIEPVIYTDISPEEARHHTVVEVRLSDGRTIYSQANRRSWLELKAWLSINTDVHIIGMWFRFRDNVVTIHEGPGIYFFSFASIAWCGGPVQHQYIGGYSDDGIWVKRKKYIVPELLLIEEDEVSIDTDYIQKGLILS